MKRYKNAVMVALVLGCLTFGIGSVQAASPMDQCQAMASASKNMASCGSKDWQKNSRMMLSCPMATKTIVTTTRKVYSKGPAKITQAREVASMEGSCAMGAVPTASRVKAMPSSCCQ